jgi:hypothetical protein
MTSREIVFVDCDRASIPDLSEIAFIANALSSPLVVVSYYFLPREPFLPYQAAKIIGHQRLIIAQIVRALFAGDSSLN